MGANEGQRKTVIEKEKKRCIPSSSSEEEVLKETTDCAHPQILQTRPNGILTRAATDN